MASKPTLDPETLEKKRRKTSSDLDKVEKRMQSQVHYRAQLVQLLPAARDRLTIARQMQRQRIANAVQTHHSRMDEPNWNLNVNSMLAHLEVAQRGLHEAAIVNAYEVSIEVIDEELALLAQRKAELQQTLQSFS